MSTKVLVTLLAAATLVAGQAVAAGPVKVAAVKGDVTVMGSKGAIAARAGTALNAGDRIVARAGQADLRYGDGCLVTVKANAMVTIGSQSPCAGGRGVVSAQSADAAQWFRVNSLDASTILAGAGAVALIGAVIYGLTDPTKCNGTLETDGQCTPTPVSP